MLEPEDFVFYVKSPTKEVVLKRDDVLLFMDRSVATILDSLNVCEFEMVGDCTLKRVA